MPAGCNRGERFTRIAAAIRGSPTRKGIPRCIITRVSHHVPASYPIIPLFPKIHHFPPYLFQLVDFVSHSHFRFLFSKRLNFFLPKRVSFIPKNPENPLSSIKYRLPSVLCNEIYDADVGDIETPPFLKPQSLAT